MSEISIIAPCFNEEEVVGLFYQRLRSSLDRCAAPDLRFSVILVDDGSTDSTLNVLHDLASRDAAVTVLSLSRNFGHQVALSAGMDHAEADAVILMDSDLQHPPDLIPEMIRLWTEGFDIVSAVRRRTADATPFKSVSASSFYAIFNFFSDTKILSGVADFCLLSRRVCETIRSMPERHRFLRGMLSWVGFRRATVPYSAPPRAAGTRKYTFGRMLHLAADAVFSFTAGPIRLAARLGLLVVFLSAVYFVYIMIRYLFYGRLVEGWASLIVVVLCLGGFQLLFIGLIGEYLARIFEESKGRPLYILKEAPGGVKKTPGGARRNPPQQTSRQ